MPKVWLRPWMRFSISKIVSFTLFKVFLKWFYFPMGKTRAIVSGSTAKAANHGMKSVQLFSLNNRATQPFHCGRIMRPKVQLRRWGLHDDDVTISLRTKWYYLLSPTISERTQSESHTSHLNLIICLAYLLAGASLLGSTDFNVCSSKT